jgi:hypothetical protein
MVWRSDDITMFDLVAEQTDHPIATAWIQTPAGVIVVMAEVSLRDRTLCLRGMHIEGPDPNTMGPANLRVLAEAVMERMNCDGIEIEGGTRSTGANPGRRPRPVRFTRRIGPPSGGKA